MAPAASALTIHTRKGNTSSQGRSGRPRMHTHTDSKQLRPAKRSAPAARLFPFIWIASFTLGTFRKLRGSTTGTCGHQHAHTHTHPITSYKCARTHACVRMNSAECPLMSCKKRQSRRPQRHSTPHQEVQRAQRELVTANRARESPGLWTRSPRLQRSRYIERAIEERPRVENSSPGT